MYFLKKACLFFQSAMEKQKTRVEKSDFFNAADSEDRKSPFLQTLFYKNSHKKAEKPRN